jgi:acetyl-CoA C-acetyltransferase
MKAFGISPASGCGTPMTATSSEALPAVVVGEYCGPVPKSGIRVEAACAMGSAAVRTAYHMVASGETDIVMAVGVEKMNESPTPTVVEFIGRAGSYFFENFGLTFPGYYALYATAHMRRYGATGEDLCKVAVKNHYYGSLNPQGTVPKGHDCGGVSQFALRGAAA